MIRCLFEIKCYKNENCFIWKLNENIILKVVIKTLSSFLFDFFLVSNPFPPLQAPVRLHLTICWNWLNPKLGQIWPTFQLYIMCHKNADHLHGIFHLWVQMFTNTALWSTHHVFSLYRHSSDLDIIMVMNVLEMMVTINISMWSVNPASSF